MKPSVYLVEKCRSLKKVLEFFLSKDGGFCRTTAEKRLVFLSQIDFWDWEMDELCFAVDSFQQRSTNWESTNDLAASLSKLGFLIDYNTIVDISYNRKRREYNGENPAKTVAPVDALTAVINKWNKLLGVCEKDFMPKKKMEAAIHFGVQVIVNLDKYRKKES